MTDRRRHVPIAARAGRHARLLARAGLLARFAVSGLATTGLGAPACAQSVVWEKLPVVGRFPTDPEDISALGFLRGEGAAAADPAADSLVTIGPYGVYLYNPSGAAGAAGSNGPFGPWHRLFAGGARAGLVTSAGTILVGSGAGATQLARGTNRGRTWLVNYDEIGADPFIEATVPSAAGPDGQPAVLVGVSDDGLTARSTADGAPGTWVRVGRGRGFPESFGEVPASASLPGGRVLIGVWGGIRYSDDGGRTYISASGGGQSGLIVWSFTFVPDPSHPFGGIAYAGVQNVTAGGEGGGAEVLQSADGGATWSLAHAFTAAEMELPVPAGTDVTEVVLLTTPDGTGRQVLWAGVAQSTGSTSPPHGGIMRSTDGGATWSRADAGFRNASGWGHRVHQFALSRTGVLYAATYRGVWRTAGAVVASEAGPTEAADVGIAVRPNPSSGRIEVVLRLAEASEARVVVVDALGREVAVVRDGALPAGETAVSVDTGAWPAGVYVVRATAGAREVSARLTVVR